MRPMGWWSSVGGVAYSVGWPAPWVETTRISNPRCPKSWSQSGVDDGRKIAPIGGGGRGGAGGGVKINGSNPLARLALGGRSIAQVSLVAAKQILGPVAIALAPSPSLAQGLVLDLPGALAGNGHDQSQPDLLRRMVDAETPTALATARADAPNLVSSSARASRVSRSSARM